MNADLTARKRYHRLAGLAAAWVEATREREVDLWMDRGLPAERLDRAQAVAAAHVEFLTALLAVCDGRDDLTAGGVAPTAPEPARTAPVGWAWGSVLVAEGVADLLRRDHPLRVEGEAFSVVSVRVVDGSVIEITAGSVDGVEVHAQLRVTAVLP